MSTQINFEELEDYVLANRSKYAPIARRGFKEWGRGVVIPEISRSNLGNEGPDDYWPLDMVFSFSFRTVVRELVETYNPTTEFVVMISAQDGRAGLLKLDLEGNDE